MDNAFQKEGLRALPTEKGGGVQEEPGRDEALSEGISAVGEALDVEDGRDAKTNKLPEGVKAHVPLFETGAGVEEDILDRAFAIAEDFGRSGLRRAEFAEQVAVIAQRRHDVAESDRLRVSRVVGDVDKRVFAAGEAVVVKLAVRLHALPAA